MGVITMGVITKEKQKKTYCRDHRGGKIPAIDGKIMETAW